MNDIKYLVKETREKLGPIDCVVFAAGYGMFDIFDISRVEDWWGLVETNLKGPMDLTRLVIKDMLERNTATLIYISSRVASFPLLISVLFTYYRPLSSWSNKEQRQAHLFIVLLDHKILLCLVEFPFQASIQYTVQILSLRHFCYFSHSVSDIALNKSLVQPMSSSICGGTRNHFSNANT